MNNKIGNVENMKLVDTIILNGIVGSVDTHDDNGETIGVRNVIKKLPLMAKKL